VPQIEVTFDIDANGIVNVSARISAPARNRRSPSRIERPEQGRGRADDEGCESHAEDDKRRKEEIEVRNRRDQAVYGAEKMLQDMGGKLASSDKAAVETAIEQLKGAIAQNDAAAMNRAMEQLTQAQHRAAEALYKNAGASTGQGPEGAAGAEGSAGLVLRVLRRARRRAT
jgi:molecular chaperone DnaK